jgi:preprotein translocase subunit SecD
MYKTLSQMLLALLLGTILISSCDNPEFKGTRVTLNLIRHDAKDLTQADCQHFFQVIRRRLDERGIRRASMIPRTKTDRCNSIIIQIPNVFDTSAVKQAIGGWLKIDFKLIESRSYFNVIIAQIDSVLRRAENRPVNRQDSEINKVTGSFSSFLQDWVICGWAVQLTDSSAVMEVLNREDVKRVIPDSIYFAWDKYVQEIDGHKCQRLYAVANNLGFDGESLTSVELPVDKVITEDEWPHVLFELNDFGDQMLTDLATNHTGEFLAILVNDSILYTAVILEEKDKLISHISDYYPIVPIYITRDDYGKGFIEMRGNANWATAVMLEANLKLGMLPAAFEIVDMMICRPPE